MSFTASLDVTPQTKLFLKELIKEGKGLPTRVKNAAAMKGGVPIKAAAKALAPVKTKGLKGSVVLKRFKKKGQSQAFVAFDVTKLGRRYDGKKKPINIPIWINYGTKAHGPRKKGKNRVMTFKGRGGKWYFMKWVKGVTANPFFERAYLKQTARAQKIMGEHVTRYLKRKYKFK